MNYKPNLLARSLKDGRTNTIGLVVADISNPFFSTIARAIEDEAARNNYTVIMGSSDEDAGKSEEVAEAMLNRQVDGLIIAPTENEGAYIKKLLLRKVPLVLIDRNFPKIKTNTVVTNNFQAAYDGVSHLISQGYKRIGFVTYKSTIQNIEDRKRGYLKAMADHKLKIKKEWIAEIRYQELKKEMKEQMSGTVSRALRPDALFFATNSLAVEGLRQIIHLNIRIPEDIGLITFDESDVFDFFYAPVTYIQQDLNKLATEAVKLLLNNIPDTAKPQTIVAESKLIIRQSSLRNGR